MSYRVRFTLPHGSTGHWAREYATREEAQRAIRERQQETGLEYAVEEVVATEALPDETPEPSTPQARIRELEAELAQVRVGYDVANREVAHLRDAYDAARQDLGVAKRNVARLKSLVAMLETDLFTARESEKVASGIAAEAHCKTVASMVRLDRAIELGDAMHAAHPSEEWAAYKDALAASRQGPAKASEAPGEGPKDAP